MKRKVNISEMPPGKSFEDYADDTIFILDDSDDDNWEEEENEEQLEAVKKEQSRKKERPRVYIELKVFLSVIINL